MATKIYPLGDFVFVEQVATPTLKIPQRVAEIVFISLSTTDADPLNQPEASSCKAINGSTKEFRVDDISEIQDQAGTPIGDFLAVKKYLEGFINNFTADTVFAPSEAVVIDEKIMEFEKSWDANTNAPTLANTDTLVLGTVYEVTTAGSTDFGAGSISFSVGDWVYNNGTEWHKQQSGIGSGVVGFFLAPTGSFGTGGGWADSGFISLFPVVLFSQNATERAIFMFFAFSRALFSNIDPTVNFIVYSTDAPSAAEAVVWQLTCKYKAEGEAVTGAAAQIIPQTKVLTDLAASTRQQNLQFTLDRSLISIGDVLFLNLERIGGDAADTYGSDIGIGQSGISLEVTPLDP